MSATRPARRGGTRGPTAWPRVACALALGATAACSSRAVLLPRQPLWATEDAPFRAARPPAERAAAPRSTPAAEDFALSNGLRVVLIPRPEAPVVAVRYVNAAAGEDDPDVEAGLASLAARDVAAGSAALHGSAFTATLALLGATLEAGTDRDASELLLRAPAPALAPALGHLAAAVTHPAFDPHDHAAARRAQIAARDATRADALAVALALAPLFGPQHPYATPLYGVFRSTAGWSRDDAYAFYGARYAPAAGALVVAGPTTRAALRAALEPTFGAWAPAPAPPAPLAAPPAPETGPRVHVLADDANENAFVLVAWRGARYASPDRPALLVLDRLLGGMYASRLNLALRAEAGYTYGAYSRTEFYRGAGLITVTTDAAGGEAAGALRRVLAEVARLREAPPGARELATARARVRAAIFERFETTAGCTAAFAELVAHAQPLDAHRALLAAVDAVTPADVQRVAQRYLADGDAQIVVSGDPVVLAEPLLALGRGNIVVHRLRRP